MFETLVSSRVRRTLLEHILTHPQEPFYLRGLAKQLNLSISPLRRELLRLEQAGALTAIEEGNMRFYRVNTASPAFLELTKVSPQPRTLNPEPMLVGVISAPQQPPFWKQPLSTPKLWVAIGVGLFLLLGAASLAYLTVTNQRLVVAAQRAVAAPRTNVTVVTQAPGSGAMHGSRWRLVPGAVGGFSSSSSPSGDNY